LDLAEKTGRLNLGFTRFPLRLSEGVRKTYSDGFPGAVFAYRFNETGANARAGREAANFLDSPVACSIGPKVRTNRVLE
jgi:hypothetical protein